MCPQNTFAFLEYLLIHSTKLQYWLVGRKLKMSTAACKNKNNNNNIFTNTKTTVEPHQF